MMVREYLQLEMGRGELARAVESWPSWQSEDARFEVVEFDELRSWLETTPPAVADDVMMALAERAAADGLDDLAAAAVLAWVLLPGAATLVRDLAGAVRDPSASVAANLWIEVRSFPWRRLNRVAANVLHNTRAACLRDAAVGRGERSGRSWVQLSPVSPGSHFWERHLVVGGGRSSATVDVPPELEMVDLLDWGCANGVISESDRELLLSLVAEAHSLDPRHLGRRNAGLTTGEVAERVAARLGISEPSVRRNASRSIRALAAATDRYVA